jgi:RNA polymerase sigma-70 factor (ECF subfamily)
VTRRRVRDNLGVEPSTFEGLVGEHAPALVRLAGRLTSSPADAEDVVQDTFERAWRAADTLRAVDSAGPWLRHILLNRVRDLGRRSRLVAIDLIDEIDQLTTPGVEAARPVGLTEEERSLRAGLARLTVGERAAVVLHDGEGWSAAEVAVILGCSTDAAHKRIQRARLALIHALGQEQGSAPVPSLPLRCQTALRAASAYLDGHLTQEAAAEVDAHLRGCEHCPPLIHALAGIRGALLNGGGEPLSAELRGRLEAWMQSELPVQLTP